MNNQIVRNQNLKLLAKDLTKDYPRSPRETLAGYVIAARMRLVALRRLFVQILVGVALAPIVSARAPAAQFDQSHALFDKVLKSFVSDARVNYTALKAHPQELEGYLAQVAAVRDRKSTRLNSSHTVISYAVFCLKKKKTYALPISHDG